jgi:lyso-ornithine lipid O-acyltransferase
MHDRALAAGRAAALLGASVGLLIMAMVGALFAGRTPRAVARLWCMTYCRIAGLEVEAHGAVSRARPTLFVANHVSYLDIVVLGRLLDATFVAKAEVRRWPAIGFIARLGRTVFIDRTRTATGGQSTVLAARLRAGESLILFAEGTSSDGGRVLPFKSALFAAVSDPELAARARVQPVSIAYTRFRGGLSINHTLRPLYAWYGDMELLPHLWSVLGLPGATVEVRFHEPLSAAAFASRKALARHAQREVAAGLIAGRAA